MRDFLVFAWGGAHGAFGFLVVPVVWAHDPALAIVTTIAFVGSAFAGVLVSLEA